MAGGNQNKGKRVVKDVAGVDEKYPLDDDLSCLQKRIASKLPLKVPAAKPAL